MKTTLPTQSTNPASPTKKNPFKRLSIAVKKLDQLINRAHQLGSFSDELLRDDHTGAKLPSSESAPTLPAANPATSTKLQKSPKLLEEDKKF